MSRTHVGVPSPPVFTATGLRQGTLTRSDFYGISECSLYESGYRHKRLPVNNPVAGTSHPSFLIQAECAIGVTTSVSFPPSQKDRQKNPAL
ncbi:hypothetical protein CEXT_354471 [Caerostris extrusa]|uniref:Uncharacterized protein n=1 Tax=Caerostris extrusa TaxID=172846 RepID=A0AAV4XBU8_CAEEX|nr:hypothetical protein CEXT_354471 [Caerostris extrusa]